MLTNKDIDKFIADERILSKNGEEDSQLHIRQDGMLVRHYLVYNMDACAWKIYRTEDLGYITRPAVMKYFHKEYRLLIEQLEYEENYQPEPDKNPEWHGSENYPD